MRFEKYLILAASLLIIPVVSFSQSWDQPVTVYSGGYNSSPDFFIDSCNVIHCVWEHEIDVNYRKIYYSKSTDFGSTWSEAEDISLNDHLWISNPHIVADKGNNLYVSYDFNTGSPNNMLVLLKKFDGTQWGYPDTISTGMPGSMQSRLAIDYDDKLYCFWANGTQGGKIFYRTLIKNVGWSEIYQPYSGNNDYFFLNKAVVDHKNNLHCSGDHHYAGQSLYYNRAIYFNYQNGVWSDYTELGNDRTTGGLDIALDSNSYPSITWGQYTSNTIPPNQGTFVDSYDGTSWSPPHMLVEDTPNEQAIAIDRYSNIYIIENEKNDTGYQQVCYRKTVASWIREVLAQDNFGYFRHKLIYKNDKLFMLYIKVDTLLSFNPTTSIQMRKCRIIAGIHENDNYDPGLIISPNPFREEIQIKFHSTTSKHIQLRIFNPKGQLIKTLMNGYKAPGDYCIYWDGKLPNGNDISPGQYLLRFKSGNIVDTNLIVKIE